ncbi:MAG: molybdenum cofactor biosynthesis protein MoaE [Nevskia sp.]|nr:molybdenum cofactor biosynthesis protein MoaE [Nevskia sp.]
MSTTQRLHQGGLLLADWLNAAAPADCGALACFAGTVRNQHEGRAVSGMHYHAYPALAEARLLEIENEAATRFGAYIRVAHAVGELAVGDVSVVVVVHAPHRAEAFSACRWAIDAIKQTIPIWKEERYLDAPSRFLEGQVLKPVKDA